MLVPFVKTRVIQPDELLGQWVKMVRFGVLVSVAATVGPSEVVWVGGAAQTHRDDVVKLKIIGRKAERGQAILAVAPCPSSDQVLISQWNIGLSSTLLL